MATPARLAMSAEDLAVLADDIASMAQEFIDTRDDKSLRNMATNLARMIRIHGTATVARLTTERDKWLAAFNQSEQFQSGPTQRAEKAEAEVARLTARGQQLERLLADAAEWLASFREPLMSTPAEEEVVIIAHTMAQRIQAALPPLPDPKEASQ